jgi:hypothetical protein
LRSGKREPTPTRRPPASWPLLLLAAACSNNGAVSLADAAGPPLDDAAGTDAGADVAPQEAAADAAPGRCDAPDGGASYLCESFDQSANVPAPFQVSTSIAATVDVSNQSAFSAPSSLHAAFNGPGTYNSLDGAIATATVNAGLTQPHLAFRMQLAGQVSGELEVAELAWSAGTTRYALRFGVNNGAWWLSDSGNLAYSALSAPPPTDAWSDVTIDANLGSNAVHVKVDGTPAFDVLVASPAGFAPTSCSLALGIVNVAADVAGTTPGVFLDDVALGGR